LKRNLIRLLVVAVLLAVLTYAIRSRFEWYAPQGTTASAKKYPSPPAKWTVQLAKDAHGSPALGDDGTIYVGTPKGLVAVSAEGRIKWVFDDSSEKAYLTDSGSDELVWESRPRTANLGAPMVAQDGNIYVVSNDGTLYCVQPDGALRWKNSTGGYTGGPPVAVDEYGFVYMATHRAVTGRRVLDGEEVWRAESSISGVPVLSKDNMIVAGVNGGVVVMHQGGLTSSEFRPSGGISCGEPILGGDGTIYSTCSDRKFYALTESGQVKRELAVEGSYYDTTATIGADGTIYLNYFGTVRALTPDLKEKWKYEHHGTIRFPPLLGDDGTVYMSGGTNHSVTALTADGNVRWIFNTNAVLSNSPAMATDGTLYSLQDDGKLVALTSGSGGLMQSAWPKYRRDSRNSGAQ